MKRLSALMFAMTGAYMLFASCGGDDEPVPAPKPDPVPDPVPEVSTLAKGADVGWMTQLESEGHKFYTPSGQQKELLSLLKDDCGVNAIRLRVWVDPADGWNGVDDVVAKAKRAAALGMRLMIDFHFSDTWADPGKQYTPKAWEGMSLEETKQALAAHVTDVLGRLKSEGITPEWVQIGNETTQGFIWPLGKDDKPGNFTQLFNAGYEASKKVFPEAKVLVHIDRGEDQWRYDHILGILSSNGGKYDMVGMSFYPESSDYVAKTRTLLSNIDYVFDTYKKPVMVVETGMRYTEGKESGYIMKSILDAARSKSDDRLQGVFYWEPEAPAGYNGGYDKGAFVDGKPNEAFDAFK